MSTDPALLWNAPPPLPRKPRPAEHLWTMRKKGHGFEAMLRGHGELGWEVQFFIDGEFMYGHRWALRSQALAEAEEQRRELVERGWQSDVLDGK